MNSFDVLTNFTAETRTRRSRYMALEHDPVGFGAAPPSLEKSFQVFKRRRARQSQRPSPPSEEGKVPRNEKDDWSRLEENRRSSGTCFGVLFKNRQRVFTSWQNWSSAGLQALFFPSFPHPEPLHRRHLNMSFAGARQFVASNNTFNEAKTVSGTFVHQES